MWIFTNLDAWNMRYVSSINRYVDRRWILVKVNIAMYQRWLKQMMTSVHRVINCWSESSNKLKTKWLRSLVDISQNQFPRTHIWTIIIMGLLVFSFKMCFLEFQSVDATSGVKPYPLWSSDSLKATVDGSGISWIIWSQKLTPSDTGSVG